MTVLCYNSYLHDPDYWVSPEGDRIKRFPRLEGCVLTRPFTPLAKHVKRYHGQEVFFMSNCFKM